MFKFVKQDGADGIYFVQEDGALLGKVARVGNGPAWVAYDADETLNGGRRYQFPSRQVAAEKLAAYAATGNREWIAPTYKES